MPDINVFPHLEALSNEVLLLGYNPTNQTTVHFSVGELKSFLGSSDTPPTVSDSQAVIDAIQETGITLSEAQKTACADRITALKNAGVWEKLIGYYGFLGGTAENAESHAINWKSPGTFDLTWSGEVIHSAQGVQGTANSKGSTGFNPSIEGVLTDSTSFGFYCRTESATGIYDCGAFEGEKTWGGVLRWVNNLTIFDSPVSSRIMVNSPGSSGFTVMSMISGSGFVMRNGQILTAQNVPAATVADINGILDFMPYGSPRQYASFFFAKGLTQQEAASISASEQVYQIALGRAL